jgi:hypothetical protein
LPRFAAGRPPNGLGRTRSITLDDLVLLGEVAPQDVAGRGLDRDAALLVGPGVLGPRPPRPGLVRPAPLVAVVRSRRPVVDAAPSAAAGAADAQLGVEAVEVLAVQGLDRQ